MRPTDDEIRRVLRDFQIMADGAEFSQNPAVIGFWPVWASNCALLQWFLGEGPATPPLESIDQIEEMVAMRRKKRGRS